MVLLADEEVLLIGDSDPGVPGSAWWVVPGGGIDEGESAILAALREVHEETGLHLDPCQLEGPVARRIVVHGYSDRIRVQEEVFLRARCGRFQPSTAGWTASERNRMTGHRWFPLSALPDSVWPSDLIDLVERRSVEMGMVEESTVPLTEHEWDEVGKLIDDAGNCSAAPR